MLKLYPSKLTISAITKTLFILLFASNVFASHTSHRTARSTLSPQISKHQITYAATKNYSSYSTSAHV